MKNRQEAIYSRVWFAQRAQTSVCSAACRQTNRHEVTVARQCTTIHATMTHNSTCRANLTSYNSVYVQSQLKLNYPTALKCNDVT